MELKAYGQGGKGPAGSCKGQPGNSGNDFRGIPAPCTHSRYRVKALDLDWRITRQEPPYREHTSRRHPDPRCGQDTRVTH